MTTRLALYLGDREIHNGNVYLVPNQDAGFAWRSLDGGDGGVNRFVDDLGAVLRFSNDGLGLKLAFWNPAINAFENDPPIPIDYGRNVKRPRGPLEFTSLEIFPAPIWKEKNQLMYGAAGHYERFFGFFANADGSKPILRELLDFDENVNTIGSVDGVSVLVGTVGGKIYSVDTASRTASQHTLPATVDLGPVARIEHMLAGTALSAITGQYFPLFALVGDQLLRFDGWTWTVLPGRGWTAFAVDSDSSRIFACTLRDVWVSTDYGDTWTDESKWLPANPHCTDLRIASDGKGGRNLYLSTYGRSVWQAGIAYRERGYDLGLREEIAQILAGIVDDGGGFFRIGNRVVKVPPRLPSVRDGGVMRRAPHL